MSLTILTITDSSFFSNLKSVIASVKNNFPEGQLYCHLINPTNTQLTLLKSQRELTLNIEYKKFKNEETKRGYCVNVRSILIDKLLKEGHSSILYLDADSIIRKNCTHLEKLIQKNDLVILKRNETGDIKFRFNCGIIGFKNTPTTRLFVKKWVKKIEEIDFYKWFSDQIGFAYIYEEMRNHITLYSMPPTYHDWFFRQKSHIWTGKGDRKYANQIFKVEERFYQKAFNRTPNNWDKIKLSIQQLFWRAVYFISTLPSKIQYKLIRIFSKKNE